MTSACPRCSVNLGATAEQIDALDDAGDLRLRLKDALVARGRFEHNAALLQAAVRASLRRATALSPPPRARLLDRLSRYALVLTSCPLRTYPAAQNANLKAELANEPTRAAGAAPHDSLLGGKEHARYKSVARKLEQLVGVHRTLLRKYATLELESAELRKKISLRDDRIAQLEATARTRNANLRMQAATHLREMSRLRSIHERQLTEVALSHSVVRSRLRPRSAGKAGGGATVNMPIKGKGRST